MSETPLGTPSVKPALDRLDSWKEIAAYLHRDVTTVQRWEKREGMPVHRHLHDKAGSITTVEQEARAGVRYESPNSRLLCCCGLFRSDAAVSKHFADNLVPPFFGSVGMTFRRIPARTLYQPGD